jgi:hypothetical protein
MAGTLTVVAGCLEQIIRRLSRCCRRCFHWCEIRVHMTLQAVILGVGMTAAMVTVAMQSGTAGDLVNCRRLHVWEQWQTGHHTGMHMGYSSLARGAAVSRTGLFCLQVLVHGMLTQLWAPLVSVGGLYRRLRKVSMCAQGLPTIDVGHCQHHSVSSGHLMLLPELLRISTGGSRKVRVPSDAASLM